MRVLITGGFGFLGGRIAIYFAEQGNEVYLASRNLRTIPDWCPSAKIIQLQWDDQFSLRNACNGIDLVIHASGMNAADCHLNPVDALHYNGLATAYILEAAIREKVPRFIFLSTSHVYCSPLIGLITEESCTQNLHPYATSNKGGENSVLWAHSKGEIEGVVLRLSNIVGAPAHKDVNVWNLLTNDLCNQAVSTGKMALQTVGNQYRNFLGVNSFLIVLQRLSQLTFKPFESTVFNIGNNYSLLVSEMAMLIKCRCDLVLGKEIKLEIPVSIGVVEIPAELEYSNKKLKNLGIPIVEEMDQEIDSIIQFCTKHF